MIPACYFALSALSFVLHNAIPSVSQRLCKATPKRPNGHCCYWWWQLSARSLCDRKATRFPGKDNDRACGQGKVSGGGCRGGGEAIWANLPISLKRRFQQNQNDCVFTVLSLLPTLGDQILNEMNIEAVWTKLQEARKAERLEQKRLREQAAAAEAEAAKAAAASTTTTTEEEDVKEEENEKKEEESTATKEQDQHVNESKEKGEDASTQKPLDESVGSLGASVGSLGTPTQQPEGSASPVTPGLLDKDEKYKLWEEIKMKSKSWEIGYQTDC